MAKEFTQIHFDYSGEDEVPKEFLSGQPVAPQKKGKRGRKSLKDPQLADDTIQLPEDDALFRKAYYSMKEVREMFKLPGTQLRYWATEFDDILEPRKNSRGDRHFRPQDVKTLLLIHDLIRRRKFTIEGAREFLKKNAKAKDQYELIASLQKIKAFLLEIKASL